MSKLPLDKAEPRGYDIDTPPRGGDAKLESQVNQMAKEKFNITGMTCSACSAHVEKAGRRLEGLDDPI